MKINNRIIELVEALDSQTVRQGDNKGKQAHSITFLKVVILDILSNNYHALTVGEIFDKIHEDSRLDKVKKKSIRSLRYHLNDMVSSNLLDTEIVFERDPSTFERLKFKKVNAYRVSQKIDGYTFLNVKKSGLDILQSCNMVFQKFKSFPFFEDLNTFIQQYEKELNDREIEDETSPKFSIVDFDSKIKSTDVDILKGVYFSIEDCVTINFDYQGFPLGTEKERKISRFENFKPYLIKEHKYRWYLVGKPSFSSDFFTLGIDRISNIERNYDQKDYFVREHIDFNKLYRHSIGIYSSWDDENGTRHSVPIEISFELKNGDRYNNIAYLHSNPIHSVQKIDFSNFDQSGYVKVSLIIFPDTDLVRHLRTFGVHNIRNIQPDFLDVWVREK